jgi:hypothetical protein
VVQVDTRKPKGCHHSSNNGFMHVEPLPLPPMNIIDKWPFQTEMPCKGLTVGGRPSLATIDEMHS